MGAVKHMQRIPAFCIVGHGVISLLGLEGDTGLLPSLPWEMGAW